MWNVYNCEHEITEAKDLSLPLANSISVILTIKNDFNFQNHIYMYFRWVSYLWVCDKVRACVRAYVRVWCTFWCESWRLMFMAMVLEVKRSRLCIWHFPEILCFCLLSISNVAFLVSGITVNTLKNYMNYFTPTNMINT